MIKIEQLSKSFGDQVVLDGIDLEIKAGEIVAILGESGSGKSVLLKLMMGLIEPDSGKIVIDGQDVAKLSEHDLLKMRKKIGYLFQEGALYDFMNVFENVAFPLREHTAFDGKTIKRKVQETLELVDLKDVDTKLPAELSGGMKKRVGLARAIVLDSKILFCDEPTSGLDPIRSRDITDLLHGVSRKLNCTTVMTSHDMKNSLRIADRLVLIKDSKARAVGTREELLASGDEFVKAFIG